MNKPRDKRALTVGVTGGIGSGKTEVCRVFASLGATVIEADALAKEMMDSDPVLRKQLEQAFGPMTYSTGGSLNRQRLANLVFANSLLRLRLNAIVHPVVIGRIREIIDNRELATALPMIVVEAALIYEARAEQLFDYVIMVEAGQRQRVRRVVRRDGATHASVLQRMNVQLAPEVVRRKADFVICNDGDVTRLRRNSRFLFSLLSKVTPESVDGGHE